MAKREQDKFMWNDPFITYERRDVGWLRGIGALTPTDKAFVNANGMWFLHGTTERALTSIQTGAQDIRMIYDGQLAALGGTYLTTSPLTAREYAKLAAQTHPEAGRPVVIEISPIFDLFPDEDWVACFQTTKFDPHPRDRYAEFFADLISDYPGDINLRVDDRYPITEHYRNRYEELNAAHGINWLDGLEYSGNLRQREWLTAEQIVRVYEFDR